MAQDRLGFFDTAPNRGQVRLGLAVVCLVAAAGLLTLPVVNRQWPEINAFVPVIDAMMCLGDLVTGTLLLVQASVFRSRALMVLGVAYLFTGLMLIPHALTFPGAFAPHGLLGAGLNTTSWLAIFRRLGLPIGVLLYVWFRRADAAAPPRAELPVQNIGLAVFAAFALAGAATALTTFGHDLLPAYYVDQVSLIYARALSYESVMFALYAVAAAVLLRHRSSVLDLWLLVALGFWLIQSLQIMTLHGRFTLGFYWLYVTFLVSHLVVMLALLAEAGRLYARLVVATAARDSERDARLMSLDALAAVISHEVGQPLTGIGLHARAGLRRLTAPQPNIELAIQAQRDTLEAWRRTLEVLKSIRAMFAQRPALPVEFSLNELVGVTTALLARDMSAQKVSLQLALDETLPPILADRVQIQRVLVNLLTNAIDSLGRTQGRPREISIRSTIDPQGVRLDISDNGVGIRPEAMGQIFDAFFTTKPAGTGLGLALCRTIVEAFGGRLWVVSGEGQGATFHLQLPPSRLAAL